MEAHFYICWYIILYPRTEKLPWEYLHYYNKQAGDIGTPCLSTLDDLKYPYGESFKSIEKEEVDTHQEISRDPWHKDGMETQDF